MTQTVDSQRVVRLHAGGARVLEAGAMSHNFGEAKTNGSITHKPQSFDYSFITRNLFPPSFTQSIVKLPLTVFVRALGYQTQIMTGTHRAAFRKRFVADVTVWRVCVGKALRFILGAWVFWSGS